MAALEYQGEPFKPVRDVYSFENADGSRRTETPGGHMRIETDHLGGPFSVSVEYFCESPAVIDWLQDFFINEIKEGSESFTCALALDSAELFDDYTVRLLSPPDWVSNTGHTARVRCTYEAERHPDSFELLEVLFGLYPEYGDDLPAVLNELEILTNETMDGSIPG